MHANFPDWYRSAQVSADATLLAKRWSGVEELTRQPTGDLMLMLLRLFAVPNTPESAATPAFRQPFKTHDPAFLMRDNLQEVRVLAGAVLRIIIDAAGKAGSNAADLAALGLVAASYSKRASVLSEPDHLRAAQTYIVERARSLRSSSDDPQLEKTTYPRERYDAHLKQPLAANGGLPTLQEPLFAALSELQTTALTAASKALSRLQRAMDVQGEELDVLWWLQSSFSRDLTIPFASLPKEAAPILLPSEVADLVIFTPGPAYGESVVLQALRVTIGADISTATHSLARSVNATPRDWRQKQVDKEDLPKVGSLCPILFALHSSLLTDTDETWQPVFAKACDIDSTIAIPASDIALQVYRERMFLQSIREL
jgi:hypothetical protein